MKKFFLYFGIGFSSLMLFAGIMITFVQNSGNDSKVTDIILIAIFTLLDIFCIRKLIKDRKKTKELDKKIEHTFNKQQTQATPNIYNNAQQRYTPPTTKQDSQDLQSEQKPLHIVADDSQVFISTGNTVVKADGSEITDEEVQYLIQSDYQKHIQKEQQSNPKFHRTPREEELSFQFFYNHGSEIQKWESSFEDPYRKSFDAVTIEEKLVLLEEAAENFEKAKKRFFAKGKGATIYFEDTWLYMHNSKNECFSYGDMIQNSINKLKERY